MNPKCLIQLVLCRHNHKNIDVAVGVRPSIGVRAKQNDLVRLELLGDITRKLADDPHGHIRPAIPPDWLVWLQFLTLIAHRSILPPYLIKPIARRFEFLH